MSSCACAHKRSSLTRAQDDLRGVARVATRQPQPSAHVLARLADAKQDVARAKVRLTEAEAECECAS